MDSQEGNCLKDAIVPVGSCPVGTYVYICVLGGSHIWGRTLSPV